MNGKQIEMVSTEQLLPEKHVYRVLKSLIDFGRVTKSVKIKEHETGAEGYGMVRLVMCLILQFMENLSDREFERFIGENIAGKWFCDFKLMEKTPDYTTICKFRNRIGCKNCANIFAEVKRQLTAKGYMSEVFTFVDSTALVSRLSMWEERDKAIADGYEKLNNKNMERYSADKEARIGAKSGSKFWIGYKKTVSVDMGSGMINKVCVTKANVTDEEAGTHVCPQTGAVVADKGFVGKKMGLTMAMKGLHPMVILRNNMKGKNRDKDRFISRLRAPYEGTFSKQEKRVRYKGVVKNQAAEFMYSVAFNFKRLVSITCS